MSVSLLLSTFLIWDLIFSLSTSPRVLLFSLAFNLLSLELALSSCLSARPKLSSFRACIALIYVSCLFDELWTIAEMKLLRILLLFCLRCSFTSFLWTFLSWFSFFIIFLSFFLSSFSRWAEKEEMIGLSFGYILLSITVLQALIVSFWLDFVALISAILASSILILSLILASSTLWVSVSFMKFWRNSFLSAIDTDSVCSWLFSVDSS